MTEQQRAAMRQALDKAVNSVLSPGWVMMKNEDFTALRTTIKQARALDKKADNARELGLDYEPVREPVANDWSVFNTGAEVWGGLSLADAVAELTPERLERGWSAVCVINKDNPPAYTTPPAHPAPDLQAELEATNRQVEILSDALAESRREVAQLKAQPAVPDAFGTREGEHPQYIQGWNDCRAEMLREFKEKQA